MDTKELQGKINETYRENFGFTPLTERMKDIQREFIELIKWQDLKELRGEAGDLMSTLFQLANESGWDVSEMIEENLAKINSRSAQYKSLGRKTKVAILGGAFDPITNGHIQLAQFVLNASGEFDEVWLMPAYKHMYNKTMAPSKDRLNMCELAAEVDGRIKVFEYEIMNKLGGETYNFFKRLKLEEELTEKYNFSMIIGQDNANSFSKWVNYEELERMARFVVVGRKGVEINHESDWYLQQPHIYLGNECAIMEISSTKVRELVLSLEEGKDFGDNEQAKINMIINGELSKALNPEVLEYVTSNNLYNG